MTSPHEPTATRSSDGDPNDPSDGTTPSAPSSAVSPFAEGQVTSLYSSAASDQTSGSTTALSGSAAGAAAYAGDSTNSRWPGSETSDATEHRPAEPQNLPRIAGFDVIAEVDRGGMGVVYQARQLDLNRIVAIKMVLGERLDRPEDLVRFRLEAEMVARVHHPNVVQVYDSGACNGHPYLVLEWVDGGTLKEYLHDRPHPPDLSARTISLLARAMHAAHCAGVIHRDLKPGNILVAHREPAGSGASGVTQTSRPPARSGSVVSRPDGLTVNFSI